MTKAISTLLVLGASGDMAARLLLPSIGQILTAQPERRLHVIGAGTDPMTAADWQQRVSTSFAQTHAKGPAVKSLLTSTVYHQVDVTDPAVLTQLLAECEGTPAIYFALPPAVTSRVCDALATLHLAEGIQLALEKPFGTDQASAAVLNARLAKLVTEDQIHRIDHFLGQSTVLNLLGLRFANRVFEPLWNREHIERVDIVYDEQLGLEGRARYYDRAGALIDMIQSHLLQVMATLAMEAPSTLRAIDVRAAKATVLRATRVRGGSPKRSSRRGRYTAGVIGAERVPNYVDEPGVVAVNHTETLAEVTFEIDNWRWQGVPFTLRSGKALGVRRREIVVTFKAVPHLPTGLKGVEAPTILRLLLAPDEMSLELNINGPGDPHTINRLNLDASFGPGQFLAYGEVLEGLLDQDASLSVRGDTAEECWRIVAPVVRAWHVNTVPLTDYAAGSGGPSDWAPIG